MAVSAVGPIEADRTALSTVEITHEERDAYMAEALKLGQLVARCRVHQYVLLDPKGDHEATFLFDAVVPVTDEEVEEISPELRGEADDMLRPQQRWLSGMVVGFEYGGLLRRPRRWQGRQQLDLPPTELASGDLIALRAPQGMTFQSHAVQAVRQPLHTV